MEAGKPKSEEYIFLRLNNNAGMSRKHYLSNILIIVQERFNEAFRMSGSSRPRSIEIFSDDEPYYVLEQEVPRSF
jgi:hypothetical protein